MSLIAHWEAECPTCGAQASEPCLNENGEVIDLAHRERLVREYGIVCQQLEGAVSRVGALAERLRMEVDAGRSLIGGAPLTDEQWRDYLDGIPVGGAVGR